MLELQEGLENTHHEKITVDQSAAKENVDERKTTALSHSRTSSSSDSGFRPLALTSLFHQSSIFFEKKCTAVEEAPARVLYLPNNYQDDGIDEGGDFQNFEENASFYNGSSRSDSAIDLSNFCFERTSSIGSRNPFQSCSCKCQCHLPNHELSSSHPPQLQHKKLQTSISLPIYSNGGYNDPINSCRKEPWMVLQALPKSSTNPSRVQGVTCVENNIATTAVEIPSHNIDSHNTVIRTNSDYDSRVIECSQTENLVEDEDKSVRWCCHQNKGLLAAILVFAFISLGAVGFLVYFVVHGRSANFNVTSSTEQPTAQPFITNQTLRCGIYPSYILSLGRSYDEEDQHPSYQFNESFHNSGRLLEERFIEDPTANMMEFVNKENLSAYINTSLWWEMSEHFLKVPDESILIRHPRVVGGENVSVAKIPWQVVVLRTNHSSMCGGSILTTQWVLSAAHCFKTVLYGSGELNQFVLYMGMTKMSQRHHLPAQTRKIDDAIIHDKYMTNRHHPFDYDFIILKLNAELEFSEFIQPICLPPQGYVYPVGTPCYVSGWGVVILGIMDPPDLLHQAQVDILSTKTCNNWFHSANTVTERMYCAGKPEGVQDACYGDSGGPLSCFDSERGVWNLAGIVSWGRKCGARHLPGIYTKMSIFTDWIWKEIGIYEGLLKEDDSTPFPPRRPG